MAEWQTAQLHTSLRTRFLLPPLERRRVLTLCRKGVPVAENGYFTSRSADIHDCCAIWSLPGEITKAEDPLQISAFNISQHRF